ncbi:MAG: hypothetical protein DRJ51_07050 [Thermoprotei archaeon]|nr:MAG: hypothetical protein DRJ51_07050 [Thermoprotei archaeon]RLF02918.1 MAG: hypothetical protein DRJ59_02250 [Thermoprotei archaeon]
MRILLASEWFPPDLGGVASHVKDLAYSLACRGHEIFIVTREKPGRREPMFKIYGLRPKDIVEEILMNRGSLKKIVEKIEPDIVHAHHAFTPIPLLVLKAAIVKGVPTVLTNHSAYFYEYDSILKTLGLIAFPFKMIVRKVNKIIAVSRVAAKFIRTFAPKASIEVIPNGVDTSIFKPEGSRKFRERFSADPMLLYVGRLVPRKGVHLLVDAMTIISKEVPEVKLVIAGSGPLYGMLIERAKIQGVSKFITFLGSVNRRDLPDLYRSSDMLIMPSIYGESFGMVALEGMASGVPVIASSTGGLKEIIIDGINGLLLRRVCAESIAEKVLELYYEPALKQRLIERGLQTVRTKYDWKIIVEDIEKLYEDLLSDKEQLPVPVV